MATTSSLNSTESLDEAKDLIKPTQKKQEEKQFLDEQPAQLQSNLKKMELKGIYPYTCSIYNVFF